MKVISILNHLVSWHTRIILNSRSLLPIIILDLKAYASFGKNEITERIAVLVALVKACLE